MRVRTTHTGRQSPFERDRGLVLRRLPEGASVSRAVLTVSPYSVDESRRFLETLTFPDSVGDWGASKTATSAAVEIDLRARRKLASVVGSNLNGPLLVDLGGGFLAVNEDGGFGGDTEFEPAAAGSDLPGLTVTGLRVANQNADISVLRVASPPSNLTIAIEGGPVFFTHFGNLVDPVTTPDFSAVLQVMLPDLDVVNGHYLVPFVVHSDTIARLDLDLDLEFTVAVSATPPGLTSVQAPYRHDGVPATAQGQLAIAVPPGMVAVPGGTAGRAQGAFESTRVVYGPVSTPSVPENVLLSPTSPLAQPLLLPGTEVATSIDLLLTAVTAEVTVAVDLVDDLDGKPGRTSMLPRVAELSLTRDQAGQPTWVNVALPGEVEIAGGIRRWVVVQARDGTAAWGSAPVDVAVTPPDYPGLQQTTDGGLSWRLVAGAAVPGPLAAQLRLRHVTTTFHMPLELRVGTGDAEVGVSLQRFAPQGAVDLDLGFPEVGAAINTAVNAAGQAASAGGEHVANGDFAHWYRVGTALRGPEVLRPGEPRGFTVDAAVAFGPSADTVFLAGRDFEPDRIRFASFDVFCRQQVLDTVIGSGTPTAMTVDKAGRYALVASADFVGDEQVHQLVLVDNATGRPVGRPVVAEERVVHLVSSGDGLDVCLLGAQPSETGDETVVRRVGWAALIAAATGSPLDWDDHPSDTLPGRPRAISAGPEGQLFVLAGFESDSHLHVYADRAALASGTTTDVETIPNPADVAVVPTGAEVLVLGTAVVTLGSGGTASHDQVWVLRVSDLARIATIDLGATSGLPRLAIDPTGEICVVAHGPTVSAVDITRRTVSSSAPISEFFSATAIAMSPAGTHAVITGLRSSTVALFTLGDALPADWELTTGHVQPICLPETGEVLALLGPPARISRQPIVEAAAISQVVPAFGDTRYRFSFDGLAELEGAVGQLIWRGDDCTLARTDQVPVTVIDVDREGAVDRIPRHQTVVISPAGATQAEVRFFTPEGAMAVDHVSLTGSTDTVTQTWQSSASGVTVAETDVGLTVSNGGPTPAALTQLVPSTAGQQFELLVSAVVPVGTEGCAVELGFADDAGAAVGDLVRLELQALDFTDHAAVGTVPAGAVEAELRIVVPPGGSVDVNSLSLSMSDGTNVGLYFVSEAPGELTISDVVVELDVGEPAPAPPPVGGLCPPTPPGPGPGGEQCYCMSCEQPRAVRRPVPVITDAGRPGSVGACAVCGSPLVRLGGRPSVHAEQVGLHRYRVLDRAVARRRPIVVSQLKVDVPLVAISGIANKRAAQLGRLGITDMVALSNADVSTVASLRGVSDRMARIFVTEAARLVQERGRRVFFGH